jgi:hypothetical protein
MNRLINWALALLAFASIYLSAALQDLADTLISIVERRVNRAGLRNLRVKDNY